MDSNIIKTRDNNDMKLYIFKAENEIASVIIAHGASEHIYRYEEFAKYLCEKGISVYGYNHFGHGDNKFKEIDHVHFGDKDGYQKLINDLEDVCLNVYQRSDKPLFVFGHSMGSLIARGFSIKTKLMVDGIILCGSLHPSKMIINSGLTLAKAQTKIFSKKGISKLLNKMAFGTLENRLSYNKDNVEEYKNDSDCGAYFSNQAIVDLLSLMKIITDEKEIAKMLKTNYFIISGKDDPFSDKTKQLINFITELDINHLDNEHIFYPGMMHEILNEDNRKIVFDDVVDFINDII
ncbi:alpha-beta hydrolase superfamily lysophospholipase [Bacilli bacterium PM5-3]|nr:alpha-beta hydrolase superfamily lysophospholipase [Bacilli bacterium PM5-3]MDH6603187.1 alpha-beta hydrolase superfamily lysophospholipase [Bacilli bacterium PM5-9]